MDNFEEIFTKNKSRNKFRKNNVFRQLDII